MNRLDIPGGWYGEALPSGAYAVLIPGSHILTHQGRVELPPPEKAAGGLGPLYLRVTEVGGFRFAGQSHAGLGTWQWTAASGWTLKPAACGVSPVIYDRAGQLHISDCSIGSQGWRYVAEDGTLVTGDATYADPSIPIWEFTDFGDGIRVGQGEDGCIVVIDGQVRSLLKGDTRFIRANRSEDGERFALTLVQMPLHLTSLFFLTIADLRALPLNHAPAPPPVVIPPPAPTPPPMRLPDSVQQIVDALFSRNRALALGTDDQRRALTQLIVEQVVFSLPNQGWGWKSADPGRPPSKDSIAKQENGRLYSFDLFNGTTREPNDHPEAEDITGQHFIAVVGVDHLNSPGPISPPPTPAPPPVDLVPLFAQLAELKATLDTLLVENAALKARVEILSTTTPRKGDPIEVKGTASLFGYVRTITSRGVL